MSIMSPNELEKLTDITKKQWEIAVEKWEQMDKVILYEEAKEIMCRTACQWAGIPVQEKDVKRLTKSLGAMFESAASVGLNHLLGRHARNYEEIWIGELIDRVRNGKSESPLKYHITQICLVSRSGRESSGYRDRCCGSD